MELSPSVFTLTCSAVDKVLVSGILVGRSETDDMRVSLVCSLARLLIRYFCTASIVTEWQPTFLS